MATGSGWRLLTSSLKVRGSPTLLIKHEISTQNNGKVSRLKVCVTDLTYLWMETLERKDLVRKACDTSIDPVEQFDTLLEYLTKGLNSAANTALAIRSEKGRSHLVLHLTSPLPQPLKPLEWDFDLWQTSETEFTREFVVTLMASLFVAQTSIGDLQSIIRDKDKFIERIDIGLQAHNKQITDLFDKRVYGEGAAERHKKQILMKKMPGYAQFDRESWQKARYTGESPAVKDLNKVLFEQGLHTKAIPDSLAQEAWWENLGRGIEVDEPSQISQPAMVHRESTAAFESSQVTSNGTQGFARYSGLRSSSPVEEHPASAHQQKDGNESDDTASTMSDLDTPAPQPTPRRIGKIGGPKNVPDQANGGQDRPSGAPNERRNSRSEADPNEGRPRGRVGKIGGSKTTQREEPKETRLSQSEQMPSRPTVEESQHNPGPSRRGNVPETAEELANRKRAELKHDLEEKRKAPAKKKRKF